jgi:hypothetical protein
MVDNGVLEEYSSTPTPTNQTQASAIGGSCDEKNDVINGRLPNDSDSEQFHNP